MSENRNFILGVGISNLNFKQVLEYITKYIENSKFQIPNSKFQGVKPLIIFTPNPEIVVYSQKDPNFREIVNSAQIAIPDGQGIVWASKFLGTPLPERIAGIDLMQKLVELAARKGLTVGLIGGGEGIALRALECLMSMYPKLQGFSIGDFKVGLRGEESEDTTRLKIASSAKPKKILRYYDIKDNQNKILKDKSVYHLISQYLSISVSPAILFVGLGAPKQEYFINVLCSMLHVSCVIMSVGGAFDCLSGNLPRAPLFIRSIGLEWVWRLLYQPWRIKRQLALVKFVLLIVKQKLLG